MTVVPAVAVAAAVVLAVAGIAKMGRPRPAADALRQAGLPGGQALVGGLGMAELVLGVVIVLWRPRIGYLMLAVVYLGFAWFAARLLRRRGRAATCGCFGIADAPVHPAHVVVDLVVVAAAIASVFGPPLDASMWWAVPLAAAFIVVGLVVVPRVRST